jgi:hypothetical protein
MIGDRVRTIFVATGSVQEVPSIPWRTTTKCVGETHCLGGEVVGDGDVAVTNTRFPGDPAFIFSSGDWGALAAFAATERLSPPHRAGAELALA